jgi:hypothetical protein
MQLGLSKRQVVFGGVAVLAAIAGSGLALKKQPAGLDMETQQALWNAEFDTPDGQILKMQNSKVDPW